MQYMDGGSLDKIILRYGRVPELITGACGVAILDGLSYLKVRTYMKILVKRKWQQFLPKFLSKSDNVRLVAVPYNYPVFTNEHAFKQTLETPQHHPPRCEAEQRFGEHAGRH